MTARFCAVPASELRGRAGVCRRKTCLQRAPSASSLAVEQRHKLSNLSILQAADTNSVGYG
eukprot:6202942-Pleurochrysis_carterae.AAC.1